MAFTPAPPSEAPRPDALQVLLASSAMLLANSSQEAVLSGILDIANNVLAADAYAVWRQCDSHGTWRAVASRGLSPSYRTELHSPDAAIPTRLQGVEDTASAEWLHEFRSVYEAEGIRALLVVPLAVQDSLPGTITFYWRQPRSFSAQDKDYAAALANLCAAALNRAELQTANQREKQRLAFLAEASSILASSLDYETTLNRVAHLAVPHIADWCTVHIVENGHPTRLVVAHADPAMLEFAREFSRAYPEEITPDRGLGLMLANRETQVHTEITEAMMSAAARDGGHLAMLKKLQITSSILVPLASRGRVLGAIRLIATGGRHFTPADVRLAEDLARRAAAAIENAQLHRAVLEGQNQLRLAHAAARMGSWAWDLTHNKITWSDEFKQLHGLSTESNAGYEGGLQLVHPDDRDKVMGELKAALESDADQLLYEHRSLAPDGRVLWLQSRGTIHRDAAGKAIGMTGITMDITESRAAEDALRRTEKLATAGRLAATVAHEVNNPLESLTNLIFLAVHQPGLPDDAKTYLLTAEGELSRIAHIVGQTLGFYRDSASPRPVSLGQIVADVLELYQSRAESRKITLSHTAEPGAVVLANAGELKQVIANLISNALDATPLGGAVTATVRRAGANVEMLVADTGSGISAENMAHIFEPFFTTKAEVGTGLGLWVSKGIVEKHQGTLTVASETTAGASGTCITVSIPAALEGSSKAP